MHMKPARVRSGTPVVSAADPRGSEAPTHRGGLKTPRRVWAAALALAMAVIGGPAADPALADPRGGLIVEGRSVAGLALGDTRERMLTLWGRPRRCDEQTDNSGVAALCRYRRGSVWLDWTGHVIGVTGYGGPLEFVRVRPSRRRGTFATREGVGPGLYWERVRKLYAGRLERTPRFSDLGEFIVKGSGDTITLIEKSTVGGSTKILGSMGVFRRLRPALAPVAAVGPGSPLVVRATGLVPGSLYELQVSYDEFRRVSDLKLGDPEHGWVAAEHAVAGVDGTLTFTIPYEGALQKLLNAQWRDAESVLLPPPPRPSMAAGLVVLLPYEDRPTPADDGSVYLPSRTVNRDSRSRDFYFWLGPLFLTAPVTLSVPPLASSTP